jgi:Rrf2 family transcriptional regulator, iron-sulfur cluster assembly transcription factor
VFVLTWKAVQGYQIGEHGTLFFGMTEILKLTEPRITAVTMMVVIAQKNSEKPVRLCAVAEIMGVSVSYLELLVAYLRAGGLLRSFRGPTGGYMLAKPVDTISLLDIVLPIKSGPTKRGAKEEGGACKFPQVQALWDRLENFQYFLLENITLADVLNSDLEFHPFLKRILDRCEQA